MTSTACCSSGDGFLAQADSLQHDRSGFIPVSVVFIKADSHVIDICLIQFLVLDRPRVVRGVDQHLTQL